MDVSENRGFYSKTDGEKNGKPYFLMRWFGGKHPLFSETPLWIEASIGRAKYMANDEVLVSWELEGSDAHVWQPSTYQLNDLFIELEREPTHHQPCRPPLDMVHLHLGVELKAHSEIACWDF